MVKRFYTHAVRVVGRVYRASPDSIVAYLFPAGVGHAFRRKLVQFVGPSLTRKKDTVGILEEVDEQIQRYLLVMLISNTLVAVMTWLAFEMLGLEHSAVWGAAAGYRQGGL